MEPLPSALCFSGTDALGRADSPMPETSDAMVLIPPGAFIMGSDWERFYGTIIPELAHIRADESPLRAVYVPGYWLDRYPVTNAEYAEYVRSSNAQPPRHWPGGECPPEELRLPVVNIRYEEAQAYAQWRGKRLPTETEWEKAARGVDGRVYPWGDDFSLEKCSSLRGARDAKSLVETPIPHIEPVASHPDGCSAYGVEDMAGNVWEWTSDLYAPYPGSAHKPRPTKMQERVIRGGSWTEVHDRTPHLYFRCATRWHVPLGYSANNIGFRCARDLTSEEAAQHEQQVDPQKLRRHIRSLKHHHLSEVRRATRHAIWRDISLGSAIIAAGIYLARLPKAWGIGIGLAVFGLGLWTCTGINLWRYVRARQRLSELTE